MEGEPNQSNKELLEKEIIDLEKKFKAKAIEAGTANEKNDPRKNELLKEYSVLSDQLRYKKAELARLEDGIE